MGQTRIEWAATVGPDGTRHPGFTFNPWIGCAKVSPECKFCYAEELMDNRYGRVSWGVNGTRDSISEAYWKEPLRWNRMARELGVPLRVFMASLADFFETRGDLIPWRTRAFGVVDATPWLEYLILTKRPQFIPTCWEGPARHNVRLGVSAGLQETWDANVPKLLEHDWRSNGKNFVSMEPLLDMVDMRLDQEVPGDIFDASYRGIFGERIGWVVAGGESGRPTQAIRPCMPRYARYVRDQCAEHKIPFLWKQWGEYGPVEITADDTFLGGASFKSYKGGITSITRARMVTPGCFMERAGKHDTGRLLDGIEHMAFPANINPFASELPITRP